MWQGSGQDPGGSSGPPNQELLDLKDQNEQQQTLIAQLKEMLRKSEQTVNQEKVEEYANTLTKMNARAKKSKLRKEMQGQSETGGKRQIETAATEKISLLKQKLEENKAKLAERGKNQKGLEEIVTQIKAQLDDSQNLISQTPLNLSLVDTNIEYSANSNSQELYNILLTKEKKISDLVSKVQKLEGSVLDLQENLKEKDSVIDARTKAITLMSESLSKKGKHTLDQLDDTKEQMRKMQENFVSFELKLKEENSRLQAEVEDKSSQIEKLRATNLELEISNSELQTKNLELEQKLSTQEDLLKEFESREKTPESPPSRESPQRSSKRGKKSQKNQSTELQNKCTELEKLNTEYKSKVSELEAQLKELGSKVSESENDEISKLKKQLDESNKNMIKAKAQNKAKVKELTKKIDSFKKVSDANAEIVKLQMENSKLSQRIAELEEEKGSLQLKLVSTDSSKDSSREQLNELELKLDEQSNILAMKTQLITSLEIQIEEFKSKISTLSERLEVLSDMNNDQVTSEMTSIHFEEQLDKVAQEKQAALDENATLLEKIEALKKEKQDIATKLDTYMQENIELIDKLEKLSAEKVSSAESIEIVESLTQQEKLEIEAYQKHLDVTAGNLKISEENLAENPELNESVSQLTEETSELLQRIELFTEERKEVMEKMENLNSENNQLVLKLKQIENNRDVLVETYEHLQTEKDELDNRLEILLKENKDLAEKVKELETQKGGDEDAEEYKALIEIQKQEINELKLQLLSHKDASDVHHEAKIKFEQLEDDYKDLLSENEKLKTKLKDVSEKTFEKDPLEEELRSARLKLEEYEAKLRESCEEISNYKTIIEENKEELVKSAVAINELQNTVQDKENELSGHEDQISQLENLIDALNERLQHSDVTEKLDMLKAQISENLSQAETYERQIEHNSVVIEKLNEELSNLNNKIIDLTHACENKDQTITDLKNELAQQEGLATKLREDIKQKDRNFEEICNTLKEKCLILEAKVEQDMGEIEAIRAPLENRIIALENKNKEQLEKMKKIAVNLKKKNAAYLELEEKFKNAQETLEKWEAESLEKHQKDLQEKDNQFSKLKSQIDEFEEALMLKEREIADQRVEIENRKQYMQSLLDQITEKSNQNEDLQNTIHEYEIRINNLTSENDTLTNQVNVVSSTNLAEKDMEIVGLNERIAAIEMEARTSLNGAHAKISELELYIETQDGELTKYKDRVARLEEGLSIVEERRMSLERKALELGAELQEKTDDFDQISMHEDMLEGRLKYLVEHDEKFQKRLEDSLRETSELSEQLNQATSKNIELEYKLNELTQETSKNSSELQSFEVENAQLKQSNESLNAKLGHLQEEFEKKSRDVKEYCEKMEIELQEQLEQFGDERKTLLAQCELLQEELSNQSKAQHFLNQEIAKYQQKLDVQQLEFDAKLNQLQELESENNSYKMRIDELNVQLQELRSTPKVIKSTADLFAPPIQNVPLQSASMFFEQLSPTPQPDVQQQRPHQEDLQATVEKLKKDLSESLNQHESKCLELQEVQTQLARLTEENNRLQAQANIFEPQADVFKWPDQDQTGSIIPMLEEKIKTLELLLYNAEKEKHDTLVNCGQLSMELGNLVYEKQKKQEEAIALPDDIASQIVQEPDMKFTEKDKKQLKNIEFAKTQSIPLSEQQEPVVEECEKKTAYLCYTDEDSNPAFGENDDGWSWGPDEARLEQEHRDNDPENLKKQIVQLEERVKVLEMERENHLEELKQSSIKSGKLIKKLKELKARNEQLQSQKVEKRKEDTFDLDDAIQDELRSQITNLEKVVKESRGELEKERLEKENVMKRVDVLTSANERLVEMKEKQDIELLTWQRRNAEISEKLNQLEWGDDPQQKTASPLKQSNTTEQNDLVNQLNETIRELSLDNEELQALLEEQRNLRIAAERTKSIEARPENIRPENEYQELLLQKNQLEAQLLAFEEEKSALSNNFKQIKEENNELQKKIQELEEELKKDSVNPLELAEKVEELTEKLKDLTQINEALQKQLQEEKEKFLVEKTRFENETRSESEYLALLSQKNEFSDQVVLLVSEREKLNSELEKMKAENIKIVANLKEFQDRLNLEVSQNQALQETITDKESLLEDSKMKLEILRYEFDNSLASTDNLQMLLQEKNELSNALSRLQSENASLNLDIGNFRTENSRLLNENSYLSELQLKADHLQQDLAEKLNEITELNQRVSQSDGEYEMKLTQALEQVNQEWLARVDQRGAEVAESWKLHLEMRENEFMQIEEKLRKEINELEERLNALVNENNELRRNVDAEIRNEVDRVSALQQQITDRQNVINELTKKQEEKEKTIVELTLKFEEIQSNSKLDKEKLVLDNSELTSKLSSLITELEDAKNSKIEETEAKEQLKQYCDTLQHQLVNYQSSYSVLEQQLNEKNLYINEVTYKLEQYEAQTSNLQGSLSEVSRLTEEIEIIKSEKYNEVERLTELLSQRDVELEMLKNQHGEKNKELKEMELDRYSLSQELDISHTEINRLNKKVQENELLLAEENKQLSELRDIIQEQVLKIESLNQELYQKSQDYDSLVAEINISKQSRIDVEALQSPERGQQSVPEDNLSEPVSRGELDLALYMLHQRDVRCEELTVELMQLLEERDTLQLRLSNAIREKEELRSRITAQSTEGGGDASGVPVGSLTDAVVKSGVSALGSQPNLALPSSSTDVPSGSLATKLSELKSVGYKRDKTLVDEQELRRLQEITILQQHQEDLSKLPAEAAARLVDANYTLSRDVQSPSKVLLNWLWGRSTPRVNDV